MNVMEHCLFLLDAKASKEDIMAALREAAHRSGALERDDFRDPFLLALAALLSVEAE